MKTFGRDRVAEDKTDEDAAADDVAQFRQVDLAWFAAMGIGRPGAVSSGDSSFRKRRSIGAASKSNAPVRNRSMSVSPPGVRGTESNSGSVRRRGSMRYHAHKRKIGLSYRLRAMSGCHSRRSG